MRVILRYRSMSLFILHNGGEWCIFIFFIFTPFTEFTNKKLVTRRKGNKKHILSIYSILCKKHHHFKIKRRL